MRRQKPVHTSFIRIACLVIGRTYEILMYHPDSRPQYKSCISEYLEHDMG